MKSKYFDWMDVLALFLFTIAIVFAGRMLFAQDAEAKNPPTVSAELKVKLLIAQHDFDQTQLRYSQVQQQMQQQLGQLQQTAAKQFADLAALKETAYTQAKADKAAWTLTDKMDFVAIPKHPDAPPLPAQ